MLKAVLGITVLTLAFAAPSNAVTETTKINIREASQEKRIDQGVQSGAVTPKEEAKLNAGQAKIERMENKAKADGTVTKHERKHINKEQDEQSKKIHDVKHNESHVH
jgi:hypothetical protein